MAVALKLLACILMGTIAAALVGTLFSVIAVSGHSSKDGSHASDAFLWGAGVAIVLTLALGLFARRPRTAAGRLSLLIASASIAFPLSRLATPINFGHSLLSQTTASDAAAAAPAAFATTIGAIINSGIFDTLGFVLAFLFFLFARMLLRGAE